MKNQAEDTFDFQWEEDESLHDPEHLVRLKVEVMEGIMRSLNDPRPNISSPQMKEHLKDLQKQARQWDEALRGRIST